MESYKISRTESPITQNVEDTANYEGNATELLVERVTNTRIRDQIVDLLLKDKMNTVSNNKKNLVPYGKVEENLVQDAEGNVLPARYFNFEEPSRKEIEDQLDARIKEISEVTFISFPATEHSSIKAICLNTPLPGQENKMSTKQLSVVEAHEKGHVVRAYFSSAYLGRYFKKGFDISHVVLSPKDPVVIALATEAGADVASEAFRDGVVDYLFSAGEISERMSQLKNYFGMRASDIFTKRHLQYAREHYISDTGIDNHMTQFFQAITPETEEAFIELINTSGI